MAKRFTICGIDASLSSTGICFAECQFSEEYRDVFMDLLINEEPKSDWLKLANGFKIIYEDEIKCPKELDKDLKKCRKRQRDAVKKSEQPSIEDTALEEFLFVKKIENIVTSVIPLVQSYKPNVVVVEDYSYHSQGSTTQLAELKGYLKSALRNTTWKNCSPYFYTAPVPSVKKIASTKGNATKDYICEMMVRYGFDGYEEKDDQLDAIAIALSTFYSIYHRLFSFEFPKGKTSAERTKIKSWIKCLETFANRLGTKDELESWVS